MKEKKMKNKAAPVGGKVIKMSDHRKGNAAVPNDDSLKGGDNIGNSGKGQGSRATFAGNFSGTLTIGHGSRLEVGGNYKGSLYISQESHAEIAGNFSGTVEIDGTSQVEVGGNFTGQQLGEGQLIVKGKKTLK